MKVFILSVVCALQSYALFAQIDGLWVVSKVTVGPEVMTPIARWFRLSNGSQTSGNGWQQHSYGTYKYDKKKNTVSFVTENEPADEFGAFKIVRKSNKMTWTRTEEGQKVIVDLDLATALPKSPADIIKGLWDLEKAAKDGEDFTKQYDPSGKMYMFIRWDRIYTKHISDTEDVHGYWFMGAHAPTIKFISKDGEQENEDWGVSFVDSKLILTGASDNVKGLLLSYKRIVDFPK